ncbi:MAG TPA: sugar phosphate isomerase/epimerase family protein [Chloroflexota bacterium]|jgi:sugar phosphate isomerase/epimerase
MEIAGYTYSFDRQLRAGAIDTAGAIRAHCEIGLRAHEVSDLYLRDDGELAAIEAALAETDGHVIVYDIACDFVAPDGSAPRDQVARVERAVERAARLGAPKVLLVPGRTREGVDPALVRRHFADVVGRCRDAARAKGMTAMIANLGLQAAYCGTTAHVRQVRDAVGPDLLVTYDVGNYLMAGEDTLVALDRVAAWLGHVHFKDWRIVDAGAPGAGAAFAGQDGRLYLSVALGDGFVPLAAVLARLGALGYDGTITVEYEGPDDPASAIRRSIEHLNGLIAAGRSG